VSTPGPESTSSESAESEVSAPPEDRPVRRALVFSGGGARGAYEAGVVRYLVEDLPRRLGHPVRFDILCGTSVGAIHACYLAATADERTGRGDNLVRFWTSMRIDEVLPVSGRDLMGLPRRLLGVRRVAEALRDGAAPERLYGLFNTRSLEKLVFDSIPWRKIRANVRAGHVDAVAVAATQIVTGRVVIFMETRDRNIPHWTRDPNLIPRPTRLLPTHALASAAIPVLFPAVRVASTYYADGGLRLNTPLAPALRLGADRVLVLALRQEPRQAGEAALAQQRVEDYGSPLFLFGKVLNALLLDHLDTDLARMRVMNEIFADGEQAFGPDFVDRLNEVAVRDRGHAFRRIQDLVIRPSADLGVLAGQILLNMSEAQSRSPLVRLAARNLTEDHRTPESDLLSYLLFDGEFCAPLAELGYADAHAREEELAAFFTD
jgi:NTE family protein